MNWRRQAAYAAAALALASPLFAPQLLAFPYSATIRKHRVYSEQPITASLQTVVAEADARVGRSALAGARESDQPIFLTDGGWRWALLALQSRDAFAVSRAPTEVIVVNRSDPDRDRIVTDRAIAPETSLARTLAHEMTHGAIRAHFGPLADWKYPVWVREGYCDYVGGASTLSDAEAAKLISARRDHPALPYWLGRKRVEAELQRNGGSVDALFAAAE